MLAQMRWLIALALVTGCGGDDSSSMNNHIDAGDDGMGDGMHADAPPCTGGAASMLDTMTGHCYKLFTSPPVSWFTAKTNCEAQLGFHLARIESASEQSLVHTLVGLDIAWLGGNDQTTEGTYKWDDGTTITTFHWLSNEPNNGGGQFEEDCIALDGAFPEGWKDQPCMDSSGVSEPGNHAYVCEHD
jgi:hypothetical protein